MLSKIIRLEIEPATEGYIINFTNPNLPPASAPSPGQSKHLAMSLADMQAKAIALIQSITEQ